MGENLFELLCCAEQGDKDAMWEAAWSITGDAYNREADPQLLPFALKYYKSLIDEGHTDAMLDFGAMYLTGTGVEKNREQALAYYKMALDNKAVKAYRCIGNYYLYDNTDEGIPVRTTDMERIKKAYEYFKEGAEQCEVNCLYELGDLYLRGEVVEKDEEKAFLMYSKAFECLPDDEFDDSEADIFLRLGEAYYWGIGTEPEYIFAIEYLQKAYNLFKDRAGNGDRYAVPYVERAYNEWKNILHELVTDIMEENSND